MHIVGAKVRISYDFDNIGLSPFLGILQANCSIFHKKTLLLHAF